MPPESENNLRLEIGHVLFIDLVGYSKLLIEEQKQWIRQLTDIVLATAQVREATNEQLVRLLTGDGMALVFRNSAEEPAKCVLEITEALHNESELREKPQFRHPKAARAHTLLATLDVLENNPKGALEHASLGQEGVFRDFATVMALQAGSDEPATQAALQAFIEKYAKDAAFQVAVLYAQQHDPRQDVPVAPGCLRQSRRCAVEAICHSLSHGLSPRSAFRHFLPEARYRKPAAEAVTYKVLCPPTLLPK